MPNVYYSILLYGIVIVVGIKNMASTTEKKCNICERYFPEQIFNLHQRVHSEDKFHPCKNDCGKVFTSKTFLLKHYCDGRGAGEKPYSCDLCHKSYAQSNALSRHNKTATHIEKIKERNTNLPLTHSSIANCSESIKEEDIKEEIKEEESVDDPLSIHQDNENKEEDLFDYNTIDIEEFRIEPDNVDTNDVTDEERSGQNNVNNVNNLLVNNMDEEVNDVIDNVEENVNEVEENVVGQENINYEALQNLSVDQALAFFSS